jgi:hypothetical protein
MELSTSASPCSPAVGHGRVSDAGEEQALQKPCISPTPPPPFDTAHAPDDGSKRTPYSLPHVDKSVIYDYLKSLLDQSWKASSAPTHSSTAPVMAVKRPVRRISKYVVLSSSAPTSVIAVKSSFGSFEWMVQSVTRCAANAVLLQTIEVQPNLWKARAGLHQRLLCLGRPLPPAGIPTVASLETVVDEVLDEIRVQLGGYGVDDTGFGLPAGLPVTILRFIRAYASEQHWLRHLVPNDSDHSLSEESKHQDMSSVDRAETTGAAKHGMRSLGSSLDTHAVPDERTVSAPSSSNTPVVVP